MLHKKPIKVSDLTGNPYVDVDIVVTGTVMVIGLANTDNMSTGVLTLEFAMEGSSIPNPPSEGPNTIDIANYEPITIPSGRVGKIRVKLAGFSGTATAIPLVVSTDE